MGGHVNMMDDVLISNLPPDALRSTLRLLVSLSRDNRQAFLNHARSKLAALETEDVEPRRLFPGDDAASAESWEYLAETRCLFSAQMPLQAVARLSHFCDAVVTAQASWTPGSELEKMLETFSGDTVQSMQALKEASGLPRTDDLQGRLRDLVQSLVDFREYCRGKDLTYPLRRAERQVVDAYRFFFPSAASPLEASETEERAIEIDTTKSAGVIETVDIGKMRFPRLLNGLWQLSSPAWGSASAESQDEALKQLIRQGLIAADMADHYGDAELVYGSFRNRLPPTMQAEVLAATKWCVFRRVEVPTTEEWVLRNVQERCRRLNGRVDLLQFHWYNYDDRAWLFILECLVRLTRSRPDLIRAVGLCNFDSQRTEEACEHLIKTVGEVGIVSNQVQFSVVDSRPLQKMCAVCERYGLKLLTYGTFAGGLISEKWIGAPEPEPYSTSVKITPSQRKYYDMISSWGTWADFQELLGRLSRVGSKHRTSATVVASRWVLQQPAVGAVIVGTRLGVAGAHHGTENLEVFGLELDGDDVALIDEAALGKDGGRSRALFDRVGDCGREYRAVH